MPKLANYPIRIVWSEASTNKSSFNDTELKTGITYKGPVVSNQLNGVSNFITSAIQFEQCSGGYYEATQTYNKGNIVSIVHSSLDHPETLEFYKCIKDENADKTIGITNRPPVKDATLITSETNGITYYSGGTINGEYWKRIDSGASAEFLPINLKIDSTSLMRKFITLPDSEVYTQGEPTVKTRSAEVILRVNRTNDYAIVKLKLYSELIADNNKLSYKPSRDFWGFTVPNIEIIDCRAYNTNGTFKTSFLTAEPDFSKNTLPNIFGFNFVVAEETQLDGTKIQHLCIYFDASVQSCEISGHSSFTLLPSNVIQLNSVAVLNTVVVRNGGGTAAYPSIGELVEWDSPTQRGYFAERGLMVIPDNGDTAQASINRTNAQSVGVTKNFLSVTPSSLSPLYMLAKAQNSVTATIRAHSGCTTIAQNSGSVFKTGAVGTIDGDSSVDISGQFSQASSRPGVDTGGINAVCGYFRTYLYRSFPGGSSNVGKHLDNNQMNCEPISKKESILAVIVRRLMRVY